MPTHSPRARRAGSIAAAPTLALALGLLAAAPTAMTAACDTHSGAAGHPPTLTAVASSPGSSAPAGAPTGTVKVAVPAVIPAGEHPYADMAHTLGTVTSIPVRGRLVEERGQPDLRASTPSREMSQDEIKNTEIEAVLLGVDDTERLVLGKSTSNDEGYIDVTFAVKAGELVAGRYHLDIRVKGAFAGRTTVHLLDTAHTGIVVRSDIDLTYLDTHFTRKRDVLALLSQNAAERRTLPAMEKVYGALRIGASGTEDRPLVFISGSPRFFKRVLEARMDLDGIRQDGVMLKAFDDIAGARVAALEVDRIVPSLKEQVGYKLGHLLRGRRELPQRAEEILMGDDSEADFVVYSIYHRAMAGELDQAAIGKELARAGVDAGLSGELAKLAVEIQATLGGFRPVKAIYINATDFPSQKLKVDDWPVPGVVRYHRGAWPLILDLLEEGLVSRESVTAVKAHLTELGQTSKNFDEAAKAGVKSGFLKPESLAIP